MKKREILVEQLAKRGLCAVCKGTKMLCGKAECPLLKRYYSLMRVQRNLGREIHGSSPPEMFVGRYGYPKVRLGPLVPPEIGNTEYMGTPEGWIDMNFEDFVNMRTSLVRGVVRAHVDDAMNPDYRIQDLQLLAMGERHVDSEVIFEKVPRGRIVAMSDVQPYGPIGKMEKFSFDGVKTNPKIERMYHDELKARDAILNLYFEGVRVSSIQRALSGGILGERKRFVPTRWSITAVDDTIGRYLVEKIKEFEPVDEPQVFVSKKMENTFAVLFLPRVWSYELVEAWYPGTLWNPYGRKTVMVSSHEMYEGRKDYAEIGGCYYAARLAVAEKLLNMRRQATVIVLREAQPTYLMPVGVWQVRENVRSALREESLKFESEEEAIEFTISRMHIPKEEWFKNSYILRDVNRQRRLEDFEVR